MYIQKQYEVFPDIIHKRKVAEMTIHDAQSELRYPPKMTWTAVAAEIGIIALALVILMVATG